MKFFMERTPVDHKLLIPSYCLCKVWHWDRPDKLRFTSLLFAWMWCVAGAGPRLECGSIRTECISRAQARHVIIEHTSLLGLFARVLIAFSPFSGLPI